MEVPFDLDSLERIINLYRRVRKLMLMQEEVSLEQKVLMGSYDELRHSYEYFLTFNHSV